MGAAALAYVGLGSNLGDRRALIEQALALLAAEPGVALERASRLIETEPVGGPPGQPRFLNGVARLRVTLGPEALLERLLAIEARLGRRREEHHGPRAIDLDLLLYGDAVLASPRLTVPHPRLFGRAFVLEPLCELDPDVRIPLAGQGAGATAAELLDALRHGATMTAMSMRWIEDARDLRWYLRYARSGGERVGFVPTMGALHEGHLSLVRRARAECDVVVASVFVNPLQFGPGEDLERYPRDPDGDRRLLAEAGCDACFTTTTEAMYPPGFATYITQEGAAERLEGESRPGHFRGVLTIVLKLFHLVSPNRAYFGRKDYQQCLAVERMVTDLDLPIRVVVCPTIRDRDGVALSSRNLYLREDDRAAARALPRALWRARALFADGERSPDRLERAMREELEAAPGLEVDYAAAVHPETLGDAPELPDPAVALLAARVGQARLIDNALLGDAPEQEEIPAP